MSMSNSSSTSNIDNANELKIACKCYKCNTTEGFLLLGAFEGKPCYICQVCLHYQNLDIAMDLFLKDTKEYEGRFYNPITNK